MLSADPAPAATARLPAALGRVAWLGGIALLAAVTLAHPSATRMHTWPWALWTAAFWVLPFLAGAVVFATSPAWRLPGRAVTAGLALLAVASVASAWTSPFSAASLARTWPTLGGGMWCLLLHHWLANPAGPATARAEQVARAIGYGGAVLVGVSLAGWLRHSWPEPWQTRNDVPFGHSNYTGGLMVLLVPWFVRQAAGADRAARLGWMLANFGALLVLAGTSSRGAVLALAFMAALATLVMIVLGPWSTGRKIAFAAAALVLAAGAILVNPRLRELALRQSWSESARESNRQRAAMLDAGRKLGAERPVLGWGPGTVPLAYPQVRAELDGGVENVLQLHAAPLQLWATLGTAGLAAVGLLGWGAGAAVVRAVRAGNRSPLTFTAATSLAGYAVFSLTDHPFDLPAVAALAATLLALLTAAAPGPAMALTPLRRSVAAVHLGALLWGPVDALARDLRARRVYEQGVAAWERQESSEFVARLNRATELTPHDPFFAHQVANQYLNARDLMPDAASRGELTRAATTQLEAALRTGAHEELAHFNLGWLELDAGQPAAAARHFAAAARLVPDKGGVYFGLGLALQAAGRTEGATRAFALEWINDPRSLTSPAWEIPALAALRPAVQAEVLRLYPQLREREPRAAAAEAWTRWWLGETVPPEALAAATTLDAVAFAAALPRMERREPVMAEAAWARLYAAWREPDAAAGWQELAPREPAVAAALQRRAQRQRDDFAAFLRAPLGEDGALARTYRRQRTGYGVLALHPDGPPITDAYIVQDNRIASDYAAALFPPKGWIAGRFLLALLPANPR